MTEGQLSLLPPAAYANQQLFSSWYLETRLREDPQWSGVAEEAERVRRGLRAQLDAERAALHAANESQTEQRWIRPVLDALGWGYEVQPRKRSQGSEHVPDYALFATAADARTAASDRDVNLLFKRAIGVLEAKRWERDLDAGGGAGDTKVPSGQIVNYLVRTQTRWGILTNGTEWRLYYRDADFADSVYFGVSLPALLADEPVSLGASNERISAAEAFRYFYLLFRPNAFDRAAVPEARCWLDVVRRASERYARGVEDELRPRAYRAVTALVRGFARASGAASRDVAADAVRSRDLLDDALTVLFRLLFILYAEARELLPIRHEGYRRQSLLALRERAAKDRDGHQQLFPAGRNYWNDLRDLFRIINGAPEWRLDGIPVYDGGLFDPAKHPRLDAAYVSDPQLAEAIDLLSRAEDPEDGRLHFVDYTPLNVRHLGSIYEGLLEYVVAHAEKELPVLREHGRVVRDAVRVGDLYLATDRGERHESGSYYTPDYVVQYIVEGTLRPLVDGRTLEEILELRVLDPAMGSGHFLVAATAYLARAAVTAADASSDRASGAIVHPRLSLGEGAEPTPDHLRRLVVERCIFGVDRNPRAVELAKLSLWLATVQRGKALNFLDHHLKCGDSLLGARVGELASAPRKKGSGKDSRQEARGQYNVFDTAYRVALSRSVGSLQVLELLPSDTAEDIALKDRIFREADALLDRFRDVGDLWMSAWFGNTVTEQQYTAALDALRASDDDWRRLRDEPWFAAARETRATVGPFFHWDVEFGEAFYTDKGELRDNSGFDAVVGNPPYVRMEAFRNIKDFLRHRYRTYETRADLYVYFMERSLELLRDGGEYGVILSNKFLRANYGKPVRKLFASETAIREIVDLGGLPIFPGATVRAAILLARHGRESVTPTRWAEMTRLEPASFQSDVQAAFVELGEGAVGGEEWMLVSPQVGAMLERLSAATVPLGQTVDGQICWGVKTGYNEAFFLDAATRGQLITADPRSAELIRPLVVGEDVRRYHLASRARYLLYIPHGCDISRYPAVLAHLEQHRARLEARATIGSHKWYELQQPQEAYSAGFESDKIIYPDIARGVRFCLAAGPLYPTNTCFFIPRGDFFLLSVVNSRVVEFVLSLTSSELEGPRSSYLRFFTQYMERLPVPRITESTAPRARTDLTHWLTGLYADGLRAAGIDPDIPDAVRALGPVVAALPGVSRVSLVGSWARGTARDDSDVDLLVVRDTSGSHGARRLDVLRHLGATPWPVDPIVVTPGELSAAQAGSFLSQLRRNEVVLDAPP